MVQNLDVAHPTLLPLLVVRVVAVDLGSVLEQHLYSKIKIVHLVNKLVALGLCFFRLLFRAADLDYFLSKKTIQTVLNQIQKLPLFSSI